MDKNSLTKVALLRGINVGRAKRIPMADLRSLFEELGHSGIQTVLNSGNVVFHSTNSDLVKSSTQIEEALEARFGFEVRVIVISSRNLENIIKNNPLKDMNLDDSKYIVYFFKNPEDHATLKTLLQNNWGSEVLAPGEMCAYIGAPEGVLASKVIKMLEKMFGQEVTGRNWATLLKIQKRSQESTL